MRYTFRSFVTGLVVWAGISGMGFMGGAFAESDPIFSPMTLSEVIREAAVNNPAVIAARFGAEASASRLPQAESGRLPQLYFSQKFNRTNNPMWAFGTKLNQGSITADDFNPDSLNHPDGIHNFASAVQLDWLVYNGGRTQISIAQAEDGAEIAKFGLAHTVQLAIAQAAKVYVGLLLALENRNVVEQALETARAHHKLVESRYQGGFAVKSDLLRARVRIAELDQSLLQADSGVSITRTQLCAAMGASDDCFVEPISDLERCSALQDDAGEWISRAMDSRPDLKITRLRHRLAEADTKKTEDGHMPTVNLVGNYELNSENFSSVADSYSVGAVFRINLYSGGQISSGVIEKKAAARNLKALVEQAALGARVETKQAYLQAKSAWRQIQVARSAVTYAEEALRIVRNRYRGGLLTIVDLLDSEVALQQAQNRHYQALHDYKVSRIALHQAAGILDTRFQ